ncbi:MAG: diguanylate cyclase [candidate division NC10 bacterium]|nr:diguanylate cyclase [candidate division NC10 bacterium]
MPEASDQTSQGIPGVAAQASLPTILIVEDDAGIARMIQVLLEARGFATAVARNGKEAFLRLASEPVDLILLDVMMPGMDGYEVCRRIKADARWKSIPVVMLTAKDAVRDVVQGLEVGAEEYIRKPFNTDELVARIRTLLRIRAESQALVSQNRQLQALQALAQVVGRSLKPGEIARGAVEQTVASLSLEGGLLHLLDGQGNLVLEAQAGRLPLDDPMPLRLPPGPSWAWQALESGKTLELPDAARADGLGARSIIPPQPLMAMPLLLHGRRFGLLTGVGRAGQRIEEEERGILEAMGRQTAIALENAKLYAETNRRAQQFEALYEVGRTMASTLNLGDILGRISEAVSSLLTARAMSLMLLNPDGQSLSTVAGYDQFDAALEQAEARTQAQGRSPSLTAVREKRAVVVEDLDDDAASGSRFAAARAEGYRMFLAIPLLVQDRPVGCLNLYLTERHELEQEELLLLSTLASQAAIAVENARLFEETRQLAITDPLTGLANHRQFYDQLAREFRRCQRYGRPLTLLMLDIDKFKQFNDTFGHLAGDQALRETAEVLRQNARSVDILARYGGEEFAIILPETEDVRALVQAERVRVAVAGHSFSGLEGGAAKGVTVSIGLAALNPTMKRIEELVQAADAALYRAKSGGRNRIEVADRDTAPPMPV